MVPVGRLQDSVPAFRFQIRLEKRTVLDALSAKLGELRSLPLLRNMGAALKIFF